MFVFGIYDVTVLRQWVIKFGFQVGCLASLLTTLSVAPLSDLHRIFYLHRAMILVFLNTVIFGICRYIFQRTLVPKFVQFLHIFYAMWMAPRIKNVQQLFEKHEYFFSNSIASINRNNNLSSLFQMKYGLLLC